MLRHITGPSDYVGRLFFYDTILLMNKKNNPCPLLFPIEKGGKLSIIFWDKKVPWPELCQKLDEHHICMPIIFSPPELQVEPLFHLVCRKSGVPSSAGTVYNLPLTITTILRCKHDALIATPELALVLLRTLIKRESRIPFRLIFLFGDSPSHDTLDAIHSYASDAEVMCMPHPLVS